MKNRFLYSIVFVLIAVPLAFGQERYVRPVDEAKEEPSFLAFRTKLIAAAERHDVKYILSVLDPKIELSFGGHSGIADFKTFWKINSRNSKFWDEFLAVMKNGGSFTGDGRNRLSSFAAPYVYTVWPEDLDAFEHHVIFGTDVNLREAPSTDAKVIDKLSYNVVKFDDQLSTRKKTGAGEEDWEYEWYRVETLGGKKGFVNAAFVRSAIGYRAGFEKKRGVWKMTFFIAGD
jgi:hypothetical protein